MGCIGENYYEAILRAMLSVGYKIPKKNILISSGPPRSKVELLESARMLHKKGYNLYATGGSQKFLELHGIHSTMLHWPDENIKPNVLDFLKAKEIDLVINIPKDLSKDELHNDYTIRRSAIDFNIPLITNARLASAFIYSFCKFDVNKLEVRSWDEY